MSKRDKPVVVSTRVAPPERSLIEAAATASGLSVCAYVYRILMQAVRAKVAELAAAE